MSIILYCENSLKVTWAASNPEIVVEEAVDIYVWKREIVNNAIFALDKIWDDYIFWLIWWKPVLCNS